MENVSSETNVKNSRRRSILREFSLNTTTHGIPGIARSQSWPNRIFWLILFLFFAGVMIFFIIASIRLYFTYPIQTNINYLLEWPQYYPALTFCNLSPIRYDRFIDAFRNFTNVTDQINVTNPNTFNRTQLSRIREFFQVKINRDESLEPFFFSLDSMLISCVFNGQNCSVNDFISFTSATYGLCYTFNAKMKNLPDGGIRYGHVNGGLGRLTLQLYVHSHQYVPYLREGVGIIALVHDNAEMPRIHITGSEYAPGLRHRLLYSKRISNRLRPPHSNCSDEVPLSMKEIFDHYQGADYGYSLPICLMTCLQAYIYENCGCTSADQWDIRYVVPPGATTAIKATLCNISDPCVRQATVNFMDERDIMARSCRQCVYSCQGTSFEIKASSSQSPQSWNMEEIKTFVEQRSSVPVPEDWSSTWEKRIHQNYVSIEVLRETNTVEEFSQEPALGLVDVIANIGGHTGLWLGMSFLSLIEFGEMLVQIILHHFHLMRRGMKFDQPEKL